MDQRYVPKVELHVHLDCSMSYQSVSALDPNIDPERYREKYLAPAKCYDLVDYFRYLVAPQSLLQTEEALELATTDLLRQFADDGVVYAEIRFAPHLHIAGGLNTRQVVEAVLRGRAAGFELYGVETRLILCTLRHYDTRKGMEVLSLAERYKNNGVGGIDLAGDEAGFSLDPHVPVFRAAHEAGIGTTAHAGEAKGAESVWEVVTRLGVRRIGHGVRSIEDRKVMDLLIERKVHLEVCPSCNIQIDVFGTYAQHPVERLNEYGVSVGINTDARGPTQLTLNLEYERMSQNFGWAADEFRAANMRALNAAFLDLEARERLSRYFI